MRKYSFVDSWRSLFIMLAGACVALAVGLGFVQYRAAQHAHDVTAGLRGNTIMIVRLPTQTDSPEQIWIDDNGLAVHGLIASGPRPHIQLPPSELQAVKALQDTWCTATPSFTTPTAASPLYEVGLRCGEPLAVLLKQIQVPTDQLPPALVALVNRVTAR